MAEGDDFLSYSTDESDYLSDDTEGSDYSDVGCNCEDILKDLLMFFKNIDLSKQWQHIFAERYINECIRRSDTTCTQTLCLWMLRDYDESGRCERQLLTKVVNIIGCIYVENNFFDRACIVRDFKPHTYNNYIQTIQVLSALEGKSQFMKLLVNLDSFSSVNDNNVSLEDTLKTSLERIAFKFRFVMEDHNYTGNEHDTVMSSDREDTIIRMIEHLFSLFTHDTSLERICLVLIPIKALQLKMSGQENLAKEYIHCLKMYFIATREPLLTINEMNCTLFACLFFKEKLDLFEPLSEELLKIMPECSAKVQPRTLTDLARCKIRESIRNCDRYLPSAVAELDITQPFKEFIVGNDLEMSQNTVNRHPEHIITKERIGNMEMNTSMTWHLKNRH